MTVTKYDGDTSALVASDGNMSRRLAWEVKRRRSEMGLSQAALVRGGHVTLATLGAIERGAPREYQATTLAGLDRALGWEVGHSQRIIDEEARTVAEGGRTVMLPEDRGWLHDFGQDVTDGIVERLSGILGQVRRPSSSVEEITTTALQLEPDDLALIQRLAKRLVRGVSRGLTAESDLRLIVDVVARLGSDAR